MNDTQTVLIKLEDIPVQILGSLDRKQVVNSDAYSLTWMIKKREFNNDYSIADKCNIIYFILSEKGYAIINDEKISTKRGNTLYVPQGSFYYLSAGTECIAFCQPGFNRT